MTFKKTLQLKDGTDILIEQLTGREDPRQFQRFINPFVDEGAYLLLDKPLTLQEEKKWLKETAAANKKGQQIYLKALVGKQLVGSCSAQKGMFRERGNVSLGITIDQQWRGKGLGRFLLRDLIILVERQWHPQNIYLYTVVINRRALRLYQSLGFRVIARLPYWFFYEDTYYDEFVLILDRKYFHQQLHPVKKTIRSPLTMFFREPKKDDR